MMLKVGSEYLDFNGSVELEQKAKLFENLDSSDGDVSFQFEVEETSKNARLLNYPIADHLTKSTYQRIDCDLQDDSGVSLRTGFLRIERRVKRDRLSLSFFSGNSNWFGLISGNLSELDMSQYDVEINEATIIASWAATEGITFPLVDNGALLTRSFINLNIEDFVGAFFVHTVFKKIFTDSQIKLTGQLFEDGTFKKLLSIKNSRSQTEIDARSAYVRTTNTPRTFSTQTPVIWTDDSNYPYNNGTQGNFNLTTGRYTADVKMVLKVEATTQSEPHAFEYVEEIYIYVNGVLRKLSRSPQGNAIASVNDLIPLNPGDYVTIDTWYGGINPATYNLIDGTVKFTPNYIYKIFGDAALPSWTKQQYVSNIFQLFNVVTSFEPKSKTLTCNLFDRIKEKEPIDISRYLTVQETDYESFISSFGKKSKFKYNEVDFDEIKTYNLANYLPYSNGVINVNNDFLQEEEDIIELDFSNPFNYINGIFDMSMERMNLIELNEGDTIEFGSVTDAVTARFNIAEDLFLVNDLVRITDSTNTAYNGEWTVSDVDTGWIELFGLPFDTNATGTITKLDYVYSNDDDVFLLISVPSYPVEGFSGNEFIYLGFTEQLVWGTAYFSLLNTNRQINIDYKQSLSFGEIQDPLFYQRTILETYWSLVNRVLNDPVKLICTGLMPTNVYRSIDFLRPLMVKTLESSNLYYCNRMLGYESSYNDFDIDIIKLP